MKSTTILKQLLQCVNVPFNEYKDVYNKLLNSKHVRHINMNEDSKEATIVENAIIAAGLSGQLDADSALSILANANGISLYKGRLLSAYNNKIIFNTFNTKNIRI